MRSQFGMITPGTIPLSRGQEGNGEKINFRTNFSPALTHARAAEVTTFALERGRRVETATVLHDAHR